MIRSNKRRPKVRVTFTLFYKRDVAALVRSIKSFYEAHDVAMLDCDISKVPPKRH